jgi:hypothetical protein
LPELRFSSSSCKTRWLGQELYENCFSLPFTCTVSEVARDADKFRNVYNLISHEAHPVDCFTSAYSNDLQPGEAIFWDDNGLLNNPVRFFKFAGYVQPLAGKG